MRRGLAAGKFESATVRRVEKQSPLRRLVYTCIIIPAGWKIIRKKKKNYRYLKDETGTGERGPVVVQVEHFDPEHSNGLLGRMPVVSGRHR